MFYGSISNVDTTVLRVNAASECEFNVNLKNSITF